MHASITLLKDLIDRHSAEGRRQTAVPRLALMRSTTPTLPMGTLYNPVVSFVAQGSKRLMLGEESYEYDAAKYLIVSVDLPVTGGIHRASPEAPYLAASLALEPKLLADVLIDMGDGGMDADCSAGLAVCAVSDELLDAAARLVGLLDRPEDIPVVAPLIEREILYRLLCGKQGRLLRQIARADSRLSRVGRAIAWIRAHYADAFAVDRVAEVAGMSPASLHRHFKAVTTLSPLQYQKQIRLQEARRMLMAQSADAASIGFAVGYESPSQFSREYARLFGAPPGRDAARLRAATLPPDGAMAG
ncbi:AraC family transcriptional regulator [Mongoliimonas terrestris]|uniref:AraC family transcriptional regulator n=1 Tax=Mongoliimonas terrestris TaxID=1709001 RepID=UPI000949AABF|nr:AraC family transcriptional regulator [Mongoliimonas terrestris]